MIGAKAKMPTRRAFSERLAELGEVDAEFAVFESDIGRSTYSYLFGDRFPDRYFNLGIAEVATMSAAAGMSASGRTTVVCGYGVFLTMRTLEMVRSFVCYPNLNVKIMSSHGGLTAAIDGVTHQATEDIAFMTTLPNMKVLCPADPVSARACADLALATPGPMFVRLMRDPLFELYPSGEAFKIGGSKKLQEGTDITLATYGDTVFQALLAAEALSALGIQAEVLDLYSLKPFDHEAVLASVAKTGALLVVENHQRRNGLGYELGLLLLRERLAMPFDHLGLDDTFAESGSYQQILAAYGLSAEHIAQAAERLVVEKKGRS
jgi:transketolase